MIDFDFRTFIFSTFGHVMSLLPVYFRLVIWSFGISWKGFPFSGYIRCHFGRNEGFPHQDKGFSHLIKNLEKIVPKEYFGPAAQMPFSYINIHAWLYKLGICHFEAMTSSANKLQVEPRYQRTTDSDTGVSENLGHGLGHRQTSNTHVRSSLVEPYLHSFRAFHPLLFPCSSMIYSSH